MVEIKYSNACSEVLYVLENLVYEKDYKKIPVEIIEYMKKNTHQIDEEINVENLSKEAKTLIISLYLDYIASDNEKEKIYEILKLNSKLENEKKLKNYNSDIFNKAEKENNVALVVKEENTFIKVINKIFDSIKKFFRKNK